MERNCGWKIRETRVCWRYLVVRLPRARLFKMWFSGPSGGSSVSVVPDCVKKQNRKQKQKLGKGCRTGVREETVGGSCWKDAIGLCCLKRVMSGFTKVSCQCVQAVASFGRNPYRPGQNKRTENKQRNSASLRSRTGYGYSVKMPTSWFWGKFGCVCLPQISGRGHI